MNENLLLEKILRDIEILTEDVKDVLILNHNVKNLELKVKILLDLVKDGQDNGDLALTSKILLMQHAIDELKNSINSYTKELENKKMEESSHKLAKVNAKLSYGLESTRGKWALGVAILAAIGTIAQAILAQLLK